ncbi:MAG: hypothetical protein NC417_09630 [Candidatus Gastranaerophilales bacterium]|nr:hypothetical protein [Candidatus Gastranaerophilales bacterium]
MESNLEIGIYWAVRFLPAAVSSFLFWFLLRLSAYHPAKLVLKTYEEFMGLLKEGRQTGEWYLRKNRWLLKNGAAFHYGVWINPVTYLALCIVMGTGGFLILAGISLVYGVLGMAIFALLPHILLEYLNRKDNELALPEIKLVYHALEMQIRAGVYVTDALAECYGSVQERRLQQALLDLAGDIVMKADIYEALERFQGKFDNRYIDALCITILQALESGQAVELLNDIGEQLKDMEAAVLLHKKGSLDRSITFYQLGILVAVLGITLYACVTHMFAAAMQF